MRIDAHQHFWQLSRGEYAWLTPELTEIYRDFMPQDLAPLMQQNNVQGSVLVQAAPTVAETQYLLQLADHNANVLAVVGWVDLMAEDSPQQIANLAKHSKLRGLRPMIQDIEDADWMLSDDLQPAIKAMIEHDLSFDALVLPCHLKNLQRFSQRYSQLKIVIDHCAKPAIAQAEFEQWAVDIQELAAHSHCYCKISGLVTEAAVNWKTTDLQPYVTHLLNCFTHQRLIWGSDWPVLNLACDYSQWLATSETLLKALSDTQREQIFTTNAQQFYKL